MDAQWQTLQTELENLDTNQQRRLEIGDLLEILPDPRPGVGVIAGVPDITWLPVTPGGDIHIAKQNFKVEPFYIAKYVVTYAQYQAFVDADDGFNQLEWWQGMPEAYQPQALSEQRTKSMNNPRDTISWYQSVAFARWLNHRLHGLELADPAGDGLWHIGENAQVRLSTEWEWQWAAQNGAEGRHYPWGELAPGCANTAEAGLKRAIAVGMYPHSAPPCGALDMAGNLMEWCANNKIDMEIVSVENPESKVLRGGDFAYELFNSSCIYRDDDSPSLIDPLNGFRLIVGKNQY